MQSEKGEGSSLKKKCLRLLAAATTRFVRCFVSVSGGGHFVFRPHSCCTKVRVKTHCFSLRKTCTHSTGSVKSYVEFYVPPSTWTSRAKNSTTMIPSSARPPVVSLQRRDSARATALLRSASNSASVFVYRRTA